MSMGPSDQELATGHRGAEEVAASEREPVIPYKSIVCTFCGEEFPSRSALFRHLRRPADNCPAPREDYGEKIMLIIGYDCIPSGIEEGVSGGDTAASCVMRSMGISAEEASRPPAGFSQASSIGSRRSPLLAQESGASASADNICLRAPSTVPLEDTRTWLDARNAALGGTGVRVLGRLALKHVEFHAEKNATFRRYEYVLPAWLLDGASEHPWAAPPRSPSSLIPFLQRLRQLGLKPFGHCNGGPAGRRRRCPLWHNFSAEALPHSSSSARRLYRYYACETLKVRGANYVCLSVSGDAFMNQQVRGMVGLTVAATRGLISADDIFACIDPTKQEDLLPIPLAPVAPCSLAEVGYSTWQWKLGGVRLSPGAKRGSHPPLEGWSTDAESSFAAKFRRRLLENSACWWDDRRQGQDWLRDVLEPGAVRLRIEIDASNERARKGAITDSVECAPSQSLDVVVAPPPPDYVKVLSLLRDADSSGRWPDTTAARSTVISGLKDDPSAGSESVGEIAGDAEDSNIDTVATMHDGEQELERSYERSPRHGGSFTIGAFPPPCPPPRGNRLFPELACAAFELETVLCPDRPPSTTIAINRHARFKPHVDSGAGAGQSLSLIVGLGDYTGGELVVEGEEEDIRYRPLEFDGWAQRHWTRPFQGERYSLVWFTPKGCEGVTGDERFLVCRDEIDSDHDHDREKEVRRGNKKRL